jgi:hypothetical protein
MILAQSRASSYSCSRSNRSSSSSSSCSSSCCSIRSNKAFRVRRSGVISRQITTAADGVDTNEVETMIQNIELPPVNEIAGFFVGFVMLWLVLQGTRLDGFIARAQARQFVRSEDGDDGVDENGGFGRIGIMDEDEEAKVKRTKRGKGNIFILPKNEREI